jgi:tetratricopeptide (TPR) repeat protein
MYSILATLSLGFTLSAQAGERMDEKSWSLGDDYMGSVARVQIDGPVDVPLYRESSGPAAYVGARTSDDSEEREWFFSISMRSHVISVTDDFVSENGLEPKTVNKRLIPVPDDYKVGGELKYVKIPELHIGRLVLVDVVAFVSSSEGRFDGTVEPLQLGMGNITDLAYAILPSEGSIRFSPATQGDELVQKLGGTTIPYKSVDWARVTYGKKKKIAPARSLLVPVMIGNESLTAALDAGMNASTLSWGSSVASDTLRMKGDKQQEWHSVSIEKLEAGEAWMHRKSFGTKGANIHDAVIGANLLYDMDIAVSPLSQLVSFRKADGISYSEKEQVELQHLQKMVLPIEGEEADASDWNALGKQQAKMKDMKGAATSFQKAASLESESCGTWLALGRAQLNSGDFGGAESSLEQSSLLYHSWWDINLDARLSIQNRQQEMESDEQEEAKEIARSTAIGEEAPWYFPQSEKCNSADSLLAQLYFSQGHPEKVEPIYRQHLDLDARMARTMGNTALAQQNTGLAHEAYRQAILLESSPKSMHRLGLALYFADIGEWRFAEDLFEEALQLDPFDTLATVSWLDNSRAHVEKQANIKLAQRWRSQNPDSPAAHFALVRESKISGVERSYESAVALAESFFAVAMKNSPDSNTVGAYVQYMVGTDRVAEAEQVVSKYSQFIDTPPMLLAQADLHATKGDRDEAEKTLIKAAKMAPDHPAYALLLRP